MCTIIKKPNEKWILLEVEQIYQQIKRGYVG